MAVSSWRADSGCEPAFSIRCAGWAAKERRRGKPWQHLHIPVTLPYTLGAVPVLERSAIA